MLWPVVRTCILFAAVTLAVAGLVAPLYAGASQQYQADSASAKLTLAINIDGQLHFASLRSAPPANKLATARATDRASASALPLFYRGVLPGQPHSRLRLMAVGDHWRGLVKVGAGIYRIDGTAAEIAEFPLRSVQHDARDGRCSAKMHERGAGSVSGDSSTPQQALSGSAFMRDIRSGAIQLHSAASSAQSYCPNPIDGVCLLPEIEFAYDLAYQNLPGNGLTPMQRALGEINELEMFFESAFNYRFSRVSITMLDSAQDALIGNSDDAGDLLDRLRVLRGNGQLDFLENPRSIFHFVTGRDFPSTPGQGNVVGLAYLSQVCAGSGLNTGLTDAGGTSAVSLVMAHEIGHNLGAVHDDPGSNGCSADQFVMSPMIGSSSLSISAFSSCSIDDINTTVAANLSSSCFDFPVDVRIEPAVDNPVAPPAATPFETVLYVSREENGRAVDALRIDAMVDTPANGRFTSASVAGGSCSVFSDALSCTINFPPAITEISLFSYVEEGADTFTITATAQSETAATVDLLESNNSSSVSYSTFSAPRPTAPVVQVPEGGKSSGGAAGGGGGVASPAEGIAMFCAAIAALFRRLPARGPAR